MDVGVVTMAMLVLSGGGLWSAAGIGAAAALRDLEVPVDGFVGSSAGALVAALLAAGHSPEVLAKEAAALRRGDFKPDWRTGLKHLIHGSLPLSLYSIGPLERRLSPLLANASWQTLTRPLWVVAASLQHFHPVVFGTAAPAGRGAPIHALWQGQALELLAALKASTAVPGIFPPVPFEEDWLVDGGVVDDYPVDVADWVGAQHIVGVWVDEPAANPRLRPYHLGQVASQSLAVMIRELSVVRQSLVHTPRVDIRIEIAGGHRVFDRILDIVQLGYDLTYEKRESLLLLEHRRA
jgi:NTE family protein